MPSTVRVDAKLHARLREIAEAEHRPIGQVIADAIRQYEREKFWRDVNDSVERLRASGNVATLSALLNSPDSSTTRPAKASAWLSAARMGSKRWGSRL